MNMVIGQFLGAAAHSGPGANQGAGQASRERFLDIAVRTAQSQTVGVSAPVETAPIDAEAYKKHLEQRFGPVTLQAIGKDQESLDAVGRRMSGRDIIIAPNIFQEMVEDPAKAAYYEGKISYFFTDVIPKGQAWASSIGLTFEPCGVVIHEDGSVTYICGGGDPPEKVAKMAAENRAKQTKKAEQLRDYLAHSAQLAAQRREDWARTSAAEADAFRGMDNLLRARMLASPAAPPVNLLQENANYFFYEI